MTREDMKDFLSVAAGYGTEQVQGPLTIFYLLPTVAVDCCVACA